MTDQPVALDADDAESGTESKAAETKINTAKKNRKAKKFDITGSRQFISWMNEQRISLAFTTYQARKLFLIGRRQRDRLSVFQRTFNRCMGLWGDGQTLFMSSLYQLWRFENVLAAGKSQNGFDRVYVPQVGYTTGDLDVHDVATDGQGRPIFVNTLFSCLATVSPRHSFVPLWRPPFITKLAAEDRCHLNGLAMGDGRPRYVTAISRTDVTDSWRDRRHDGGCVIDVESNEIVATSLSMPHSPRLHQGKLWLHNSGTGHFGYIDTEAGKFEPVAFCPGYLRGLAFHGDFAVAGLSMPRERTFSGLELDDNLKDKDVEPRCGLMVIDLRSGDTVHYMRIEGAITELYDVVILPGVRRPTAVGFGTDEIRRVITKGRLNGPLEDAPSSALFVRDPNTPLGAD